MVILKKQYNVENLEKKKEEKSETEKLSLELYR